eukprot:75075-Amphidinium_carterae.1
MLLVPKFKTSSWESGYFCLRGGFLLLLFASMHFGPLGQSHPDVHSRLAQAAIELIDSVVAASHFFEVLVKRTETKKTGVQFLLLCKHKLAQMELASLPPGCP